MGDWRQEKGERGMEVGRHGEGQQGGGTPKNAKFLEFTTNFLYVTRQ